MTIMKTIMKIMLKIKILKNKKIKKNGVHVNDHS